MLHPDTELRFISPRIGYGVVATRPIPRGTITWVRCALDQTFSPERVRSMAPGYVSILDKYSFVDGRGDYVLCWDLARFVNHSCAASCLSPGYEFEVAVRDIQPGEELTDDYGLLNLEDEFECHCGTPGCRQRILPEDMLGRAAIWDQQLAEPFREIGQVAQPLWEFVREKAEVEAALAGRTPVRSATANYAGRAEAGVGRVVAAVGRARSRR